MLLCVDLIRLGRAIRSARRGLTQEELAGRAQVDQASISKWEHGTREPGLSDLFEIERATGHPPGSILIASGLIPQPRDTREAIAADAGLDTDARAMVMMSYELGVSQSAARRPKSSPRKPKRRSS